MTRIVDTNTSIPGGTGTFAKFGRFGTVEPTIKRNGIVLVGTDSDDKDGIYRYNIPDGSLEVLVNESMLTPEGTGTFNSIQAPSYDGTNLAFMAKDELSVLGLFSNAGGLHRIVDTNSSSLTAGGNFFTFSGPTISEGISSFWGSPISVFDQGVYTQTSSGGYVVTINKNTPIPDGDGTFTFVRGVHREGTDLAYQGQGQNGQQGIYLANTSLRRLVDRNSPIPGGGSFFNINSPSLSNGNVAFFAFTTADFSQPGIYAVLDDNVSVVASRQTRIPNTPRFFAFFEPKPAISGKNIAFGGESSPVADRGLFVRIGESLHTLIRTNDFLDGRFVVRAEVDRNGFDGNRVAMSVSLSGGVRTLYLAKLYLLHDTNLDGQTDLADHVDMIACFAGPNQQPSPIDELDLEHCLGTFDADEDQDIDLRDVASFQRAPRD